MPQWCIDGVAFPPLQIFVRKRLFELGVEALDTAVDTYTRGLPDDVTQPEPTASDGADLFRIRCIISVSHNMLINEY